MCSHAAPTDLPRRSPSPSSYVEPSVKSLEPSEGVCSATMSGFMTKPPAAITTDVARTSPGLLEAPPRDPTTAPDASVTRLVAPVSKRTSAPVSAIRSASRSSTSRRPPCRPAAAPCGRAAPAWPGRENGQTFSLPVNINPSVPGWITAFSG